MKCVHLVIFQHDYPCSTDNISLDLLCQTLLFWCYLLQTAIFINTQSVLMHSEIMIGGLSVLIGGQTASINRELHGFKIANTVARYPTRLLAFMETMINFLSKYIY